MFGLLLMVFQAVFAWATVPMDWIDTLMATTGQWFTQNLPAGWLTDLWVNGVWSGIQGVVVFIPQIALLFLFIALLEGTGYMARAIFLLDRWVRPFGLSGRSIVPLVGGFACAVPSILGTRTIPNPRERLLTMLITPLMSCSARIPVYTVLIAIFIPSGLNWGIFNAQGLTMGALYVLGAGVGLFSAWVLKKFIRNPQQQLFIADLPAYTWPTTKSVSFQIWNKVQDFVVNAGKVILVMGIVLWFLSSYGPTQQRENTTLALQTQINEASAKGLVSQADSLKSVLNAHLLETSYAGIIGKAMEPVIQPLGYDWRIGIAILSSFAAREVFIGTMNTLYALSEDPTDETFGKLTERLKSETRPDGTPVYTTAVAISLLLFYVFALQCLSTLAVLKRETRNWKWPLLAFTYQTGLAYLLAMAGYQCLS
jgi:ferrous iron transport protein B